MSLAKKRRWRRALFLVLAAVCTVPLLLLLWTQGSGRLLFTGREVLKARVNRAAVQHTQPHLQQHSQQYTQKWIAPVGVEEAKEVGKAIRLLSSRGVLATKGGALSDAETTVLNSERVHFIRGSGPNKEPGVSCNDVCARGGLKYV